MTDSLLVLLEERHFGFELIQEKRKLNAPESKRLLQKINDEERLCLDKILPVSGPLNISESFVTNTKFFVELSKQKAQNSKTKLNNDFIDYILTFLDEEIDRFNRKPLKI